MPSDQVRINLDIWGDEEFCDLPVDAQNLYWSLWTSPDRSLCGAHEWRPGKLTQKAGDWSVPRLLGAAAVLSEGLFLVVDEITEECLLRSWIKHDGLWRIPNMAVSMAMARAKLASKTLRGVVVHEVQKLVAAHPEVNSWERPAVQNLLDQRAIDPASLPPFNPGPNGGVNPHLNGAVNPLANPYGGIGGNPHANPTPTSASTSTSFSSFTSTSPVGELGTEGHQGADPEPPRYCSDHPNDTNDYCPDCIPLRRAHDAWKLRNGQREADELEAKRQQRQTIVDAVKNCPDCDVFGRIEVDGDHLDYCPKHPRLKEAAHG